MDSYIVRIYRRGKDDPRTLVGTVEEVGEEVRKAFASMDELWEIVHAKAGSTIKVVKMQEQKDQVVVSPLQQTYKE